MGSLGLNIQLNLDVSAAHFAEVSFEWLDQVSRLLEPNEREVLKDLPAQFTTKGVDPFGPLGEPGSLFGVLDVTRGGYDFPPKSYERSCSVAGIRWLRNELDDFPNMATLWLGHLDELGHRSGNLLLLYVKRVPHSAKWLRLNATVNEVRFCDPISGTAAQRQWLDALRLFADRLNPGFGHVAYTYSGDATALEDCLPARTFGREYRDPDFTVNSCRQILRGYSWLTIIPEELVAWLGGVDALRRTGAFVEVSKLAAGGVWLLATADYREFNDTAVAKVFRTLAPVLRPGQPKFRRYFPGDPPHPIVFEDAAEVTAGS
jgi:hypothetical protein